MKKIVTCLLATLGLNTACSQQPFEDADAAAFAKHLADTDVIVLDVRTAGEFDEGHIADAVNIDVQQDSFVGKATSTLPAGASVAVYCRSGRRSADAAAKLAKEGFKVVNLRGGIAEWKENGLPVTTDTHETDFFATKSGHLIRLVTLMHASIRIVFDGREIEIDPVRALGNRTTDYATMPKADFIIVTHEHADHFDKEAIRTLSDNSTRLIMNARCAELLGSGEALANGDAMQLADNLSVKAVPAYNTTEGHLQFHPKGRDNGYILTLDDTRIYIAGDTEDIPEMETLGDIDIAFLPCNQPYTMTVEQLAKAARTVRPRVLFPYHYGQTDVSDIPQQLKKDNIETRIRHYE